MAAPGRVAAGALRVRGVARAYGELPVLTGIDLDVPAQGVTAVLGPSGCGKTTLLRLIAGFDEPDAGSIAIGEVVVTDAGAAGRSPRSGRSVAPQRRRVGFVPQEGALFPHLDVAANIAFGLRRGGASGRARADARVRELCDLVGLPTDVVHRHPHELSGGQQQRVALARALAPDPALVLLDEPFSSLDAGLREATGRAVVAALRAAGATALLVTHDQGEALSLADQVAVMRDGRLVQVGAPAAVYGAPVDPGVARFVGEAVLLPAELVDGAAVCALGRLPVVPGAAAGAGTGDGRRVSVLVRPEQIELRPAAGHPGPLGRVVATSYYGHDAAVRLEVVPHATPVVARVTGTDLPAAGELRGLVIRGAVRAFALDGTFGAAVGGRVR